ncbi:MAG TPA: 6-bladed beta-propeller [Stellaceae bacterium]|nr:6-bladed beta-propeller [Stellaceae bacterium]
MAKICGYTLSLLAILCVVPLLEARAAQGAPSANLLVSDTAGRIQAFTTDGTFIEALVTTVPAPRRFMPTFIVAGVAAFWVTDGGNNQIDEFDEHGNLIAKIGAADNAFGGFRRPEGIAVDAEANLWVVDALNCRIYEFDVNGHYKSQFGSCGSGRGEFANPAGIAVDHRGFLFIIDRGNNRIEEFDTTGGYITEFGARGVTTYTSTIYLKELWYTFTGKALFDSPQGIAIDKNDNIWVTDEGNSRIEKLDHNGQLLGTFGLPGNAPGHLKTPTGITIDPSGNVWVVDSLAARVTEFSNDGSFITEFGSFGQGAGQFISPYGIALVTR